MKLRQLNVSLRFLSYLQIDIKIDASKFNSILLQIYHIAIP